MKNTPYGVRGRRIVSPGDSPNSICEWADAVVVYAEGMITYVGPEASAPAHRLAYDTWFPLVTPGLIDAHTHACYVGSRHDEYVMKLSGEDYRAIAARGLGIMSSHRAIADASSETITQVLAARLARMASLGVTTVEVKSGYGLLPELELRQLEAIATLRHREDLPRIIPTFLALHAWPRDVVSDRRAYVLGQASLVGEVARQRLALFVDAYVDQNAFSLEEARPVLEQARSTGLGVRLHIGQFHDIGGAELAAEYGARSVDHVEHISERGIDALLEAGASATLLPIASFVLGQAPPPVAALRARGLPMVVASDANPGTAPTESLPLAMALAARSYGMTAGEVFSGVTSLAATCLNLPAGRLVPGAPADLVAWDLPHENALLQPWGVSRSLLSLREGRVIAEAAAHP